VLPPNRASGSTSGSGAGGDDELCPVAVSASSPSGVRVWPRSSVGFTRWIRPQPAPRGRPLAGVLRQAHPATQPRRGRGCRASPTASLLPSARSRRAAADKCRRYRAQEARAAVYVVPVWGPSG
jgi:hypothetical protein